MKNQKTSPYWSAAALGALAGFRAFSALAFVSNAFYQNPAKKLKKSPLKYLQNGFVSKTLGVLSAAEMVGDKVPGVPNRIELPSLLIRSTSGAVVGAALARSRKGSAVTGGLVGAAAAIAATYGSFYLRTNMNHLMPNYVSGGVEDGLVLLAGKFLPKRKTQAS